MSIARGLHLILGTYLALMPSYATAKKEPTIYQYVQSNGVVAFTDEKPREHHYTIFKTQCYACSTKSQLDWYSMPLFTKQFNREITIASKKHNIEAALLRAVIHAESAFKVNARSKQGAIGLMQLMPETAKYLGVKNPHQAKQNILGGAKYMAKLLNQFKGSIKLATAAYNAGPGAVKKYQGVPPYAETKAYVKRVAILHSRYRHALSSRT